MSMTLPYKVARKWFRPCFVETGSCLGDGIRLSLSLNCERIISVELVPDRVALNRRNFESEISSGRVRIIEGRSDQVLPALLPYLGPTLFWLDAHDDSGGEQSAVYQEVEAILKNGIGNNVILVDDMRLFGNPNSWGRNLSVGTLRENAKKLDPSVQFFYEDNKVAGDDILVIVGG